jgi:hypothetical protein
METKEIIFLVLAIVFFIFLVNKSRKKTSLSDIKTRIKTDNDFVHNKTIEKEKTPWNQALENMRDEDVIKGFEFNVTLQFRTPLRVLKHHKEKIFDKNKELPNYAKDGWEGVWLPITKSFKELGLNIAEIPKGLVSSDLGTLGEQEQELYFDFLLKFHTISESAKEVNEKINSIKDLIKLDSNFSKYYNLVSRNDRYFLDDYFGLLIRNVLPPKISGILKEKGYFFLNDLKGVDSKELLKIEGIGKSSINKLSSYL